MEKHIKIKVDKKYFVHGRLDGSLKKPLVIVVHGLTCSIRESFYTDATRWFAKNGFAAFRFDLYGGEIGTRQLINSTLQTHAADLDVVVAYFRHKGVKKIFVTGHSFGGPTILLSKKQDFDGAALWDPSYDISFTKKKYGYKGGKYVKELDGYLMEWGSNVIISNAMAKEVDGLGWDSLASDFHVPLKIITAGKGVLVPGSRKYLQSANQPKSMSVIKGATHHFDDKPNMQEKVFKLSANWFSRFV